MGGDGRLLIIVGWGGGHFLYYWGVGDLFLLWVVLGDGGGMGGMVLG